jgi:dTDP-4-dehydrorhamnose reductase
VNGPQKGLVLGGKSGLLGRTLAATLEQAGWIVHAPGREELDVFDQDALSCLLHREEIGYLFNTVAYTQVDRAEEQQEEAYRLNRALPALLGRSAPGVASRLSTSARILFSTAPGTFPTPSPMSRTHARSMEKANWQGNGRFWK